jgi:hypothetical protein
MVICQGCGQSFAVPAGYTRNKIQCPGCGVICAVPAGAARGEATPPSRAKKAEVDEDAAMRMLDDPVQMFDDEPPTAPKAAPAPKTKPADERVKCRRCGRLIARQRECPSCDEIEENPSEELAKATGPLSMSLDDVPMVAEEDDEEDESPYLLADKDIPLCPKCRKPMAIDAVLCTACGFDTKTRKRAKRTYEPIARVWETGQTMQQRLMWLGLAQGVHWTLAIFALLGGVSAWPWVVSWPFMTGMLAFIVGTFERVEIVRDARGRCEVTSAWRFAFWPMAPKKTEIFGFEGVTTGQDQEVGVIEWMIFASLLCAGIVPAIVWWYVVINKPNFHVALAADHGHAEVYVYRGKSEEQMHEIARVLVDASGLRMLA